MNEAGMAGMGTSPEYAWTAIALSLVAIILASFHAYRTARAYRVYHDERAAVSLVKGIGLLVIAVGMLLSATGLVLEEPIFAITGLSLSRGALLVLLATLVLVDVRPGGRQP